jgi:hypothetical protein
VNARLTSPNYPSVLLPKSSVLDSSGAEVGKIKSWEVGVGGLYAFIHLICLMLIIH